MSGPRSIAIGVVSRPHGVRGELRIHLYNAASDVLLEVAEVELEEHGPFRVAGARRERDSVLLRLQGVTTRDRAEELRGAAVRVPREALPPTEQDEFYLCDLVGLSAVDPAGAPLGRIADAREGPGHATLVLEGGGRSLEVPLAEPYVREVDPGAGRVVLAIEELLEGLEK